MLRIAKVEVGNTCRLVSSRITMVISEPLTADDKVPVVWMRPDGELMNAVLSRLVLEEVKDTKEVDPPV